jgi:integrase
VGAGDSTGDFSVLESHSVRGVTKATYEHVESALVSFVQKHRLSFTTAAEKDAVLVAWLNHLYMRGHDTSLGSKVMASFMFHRPRFGRLGSERTPRAWRCLKGWRLLAPPRSRVPRAWPLVAAICMSLLRRNKVDMAAWMVLAFGAYLRPSECMNLVRGNLVRPVNTITRRWTLLVCAELEGLRSKTGTTDDSIVWDSPHLLWFDKVLETLNAGDQKAALWRFTYPEITKEIKAASLAVGVRDFVPYQLRHAGPSWDRLQSYRTLQSIQKRGRWRSFLSVTRCEKGARVVSDYLLLSAALRRHCEQCARDLEACMLGTLAPLPAP